VIGLLPVNHSEVWYNYAPRDRFIERRGYYEGGYYDNGPSVGIGVGPGGVGVGVGPRW
jgi:hypothetical protein